MGGRDSSKRKSRRDKISSKTRSGKRESKKRRLSYDSDGSPSDVDSLHLKRSLSSTAKSGHRRTITKKKRHRHRDSSLSDYSDYQSVSLDSDSSSTDENDYEIKKDRSRVGLQDVKKKDRKRSISSIGDVVKQGKHKKKRLGKGRVKRPIKKSSKRKSRNLLSSSSGSESKSSASQSSSSSSSGEDRHRKNKVVIDKKKERLRHKGSRKSKPKHKDRNPSYTPSGREGDPSFSGGNSDEEPFLVDNSRRLKSVIVVIDRAHDEEESRWEKDPHKEEIVHDQNDYPSPRSLDCDEGGNEMESGNQSIVALSERMHIENTAGEEVRELGESITDDGDHQSKVGYVEYSKKKEIDMSGPVGAMGGDLLELTLRQKALENLRKFRKVPQTSPRSNMVKINNETSVTGLSDRTADIFDSNSTIQNCSDAQEMNYSGGHSLQREITEAVKLPDSEFVEEIPRIAKLSTLHSSNASALLACSEEDKSSRSQAVEAEGVSVSDISPGDGGAKASGCSNVELTSSVKPISLEQDNSSISRVVEARAVSGSGTNACSSSNVELASSVEPNAGEKRNEEFEQKTMSVMRGGELVQVSYKVYIPKKAPALARRQLKR